LFEGKIGKMGSLASIRGFSRYPAIPSAFPEITLIGNQSHEEFFRKGRPHCIVRMG
jgi:hypothetical protein